MNDFSQVLLVSDFDDTLVDRQKNLPARTKAALAFFIGNGGHFTLASGRSLTAVSLLVSGLPINAPVIAANGTEIYDFSAQKLLFQMRMPDRTPSEFRMILDAFPHAALEAYSGGVLHAVNRNTYTEKHLSLTGQTAQDACFSDIPNGWVYAKFLGNRDTLLPIQQFILEHFQDSYDPVFSAGIILEVVPKGAGKGAGIRKLAELLKLSMEHVYCAGDNENDLSMLEAAALAFVPENGHPRALSQADVVVCDCDQGSVADVIAYLARRYHVPGCPIL